MPPSAPSAISTMSAHFDHLFSLSQTPPPVPSQHELAQEALCRSVQVILDSARAIPDDKEDLEEDQDLWMVEWEEKMVCHVSDRKSDCADQSQNAMDIAAQHVQTFSGSVLIVLKALKAIREAELAIIKWKQDWSIAKIDATLEWTEVQAPLQVPIISQTRCSTPSNSNIPSMDTSGTTGWKVRAFPPSHSY